MEHGFFLTIVALAVLANFIHGSSEDDSKLMRRNLLLEKLGMELHRDPHYNGYAPYKKRCYCGPKRRRYGRRKGRRRGGSSSSSGSDSGSGSDNGSPGHYGGYGKYKKYRFGRYRYRGNRSSDEE